MSKTTRKFCKVTDPPDSRLENVKVLLSRGLFLSIPVNEKSGLLKQCISQIQGNKIETGRGKEFRLESER